VVFPDTGFLCTSCFCGGDDTGATGLASGPTGDSSSTQPDNAKTNTGKRKTVLLMFRPPFCIISGGQPSFELQHGADYKKQIKK